MLTDKDIPPVVATQVAEGELMQEALSAHFGKHSLHVEEAVFSFARYLAPTSDVPVWQYFELSNGGFLMRPTEGPIDINVRGFEARVSAEAFGIFTSLLALEYLWEQTRAVCMLNHSLLLRVFLVRHSECATMMEAIKAMT